MITKQFDHLVEPLTEYTKSLTTQRGEKVEIINQATNKENIFLSVADLSNPKILQNNPMPVELYICNVLIPKAENELNHDNNGENILEKCFENYEASIINQLRGIKNLMSELSYEISRRKSSNFLSDFSNGALIDKTKFMMSLQDIIACTLTNSEMPLKFNRISKLFEKFNQPLKEIENELLREKKIMNMPGWDYPKSFKLIDQTVINKWNDIPYTNGIDIHPSRNEYVAMGKHSGDLVIVDQDTNKEINRVKLNNNHNGYTQNCLWSAIGDRIMVSTTKNHSIYIYDETGQKLLKSIENTYSENGYGAIWLSEQEVAVGYEDGVIKFFNIDEEREIGKVKVNGTNAWGMDCVDDAHLLIGDKSGSITNIDWKNNKIDWVKTGCHLNNGNIRCLRLNSDKSKLLTCGDDHFVKLMKLHCCSRLFEFEMDADVMGILWAPSELYVLALSWNNQLVALNSNDGTKIIEFKLVSSVSQSLRLNPRRGEILVGDSDGFVRRLKICQNFSTQQKTHQMVNELTYKVQLQLISLFLFYLIQI